MLRFLQLFASAICLIGCVALIALCVRSYSWADVLNWKNPIASMQVISMEGRIKAIYVNWGSGIQPPAVNSYEVDSNAGSTIIGNILEDANRRGFGFQRTNPATILFPHWFGILLLSLMAMFLGIRRTRRFSMRSMLVAMAVVAVLLGIIVVP